MLEYWFLRNQPLRVYNIRLFRREGGMSWYEVLYMKVGWLDWEMRLIEGWRGGYWMQGMRDL